MERKYYCIACNSDSFTVSEAGSDIVSVCTNCGGEITFWRAYKLPISSGSDEAAGSAFKDIEMLQIQRVACDIVSHTIDESAGCREDGKTNAHCIDYAVSKIKELM